MAPEDDRPFIFRSDSFPTFANDLITPLSPQWRPIAEGLTIAMDKLYSWETSHQHPSQWTPYDAHQPDGGKIALKDFVFTHTQAQAQSHDISSMALGQYQNYQKSQKAHWFQKFPKLRDFHFSNGDALPLCMLVITRRVLNHFGRNSDSVFALCNLGICHRTNPRLGIAGRVVGGGAGRSTRRGKRETRPGLGGG
ncbi:hypothetical protein J008_05641 [Cryptococcus neoformans]|nr:hypothetical protein J008_05641 [Cryptococcus neoformans var. grubii]